MPGRRSTPCRRALGVLVLAVVAGCDAVADQVTTESSSTTLAPLLTTATTVAPTTSAAPTTTVAPTTTLLPQPVGEWDGARFDLGRIVRHGVTEDGIYRTIELDRYSYRMMDGTLVDAAGFSSEPLVYWWRDEPWENNNPDTREFVLAPRVELLALADDQREAACADPPPMPMPEPVWTGVDPSYLDTARARSSVVMLTYAESGAVVRVRFATGC